MKIYYEKETLYFHKVLHFLYLLNNNYFNYLIITFSYNINN